MARDHGADNGMQADPREMKLARREGFMGRQCEPGDRPDLPSCHVHLIDSSDYFPKRLATSIEGLQPPTGERFSFFHTRQASNGNHVKSPSRLRRATEKRPT